MESRLRAPAFLALVVLLAGCARPAAEQINAAPTSLSVTESTPLPTDVVTHMEAGCPSDETIVESLKSLAAAGATAVTGKAMASGRHVTDESRVVYSVIEVSVDRQLLGPKVPATLTVYVPGGRADGTQTTVDRSLQNAWAEDGQFFGKVSASDAFRGGYTMDVLPVVNDAVLFPGVGCWTATGLKMQDSGSASVTILADGDVVTKVGSYSAVRLDEIISELG